MLTVRRLLALGVVATTVAYVAIVAPNASANTVFVQSVSQGRLVLESSPTELSVAWYAPGATVPKMSTSPVQRTNKCLFDPVGLGALLKISVTAPAGGELSYVNNGLGTREQNNCNTSNGTYGNGQAIELALGSYFDGKGIVIDRAQVDLEGKYGTAVAYTLIGADGTAKAPVTLDLWKSNDNGSDSGPSDNKDVPVGETGRADDFVRFSIYPAYLTADTRGQISLESGGDWGTEAGSHRTTLWLSESSTFEYSLGCDDFRTEAFPGVTGTDSYPREVTIARYDNDLGAAGQACAAIGVDLSSTTDFNVLLRKTTTDAAGKEQVPQVRFEIQWVVPTSLIGGTTDPFQRFIDLDPNDSVAPTPAQFCTSYTPAAGGGLLSVTNPGTAVHPPNTPWCVIADERTLGTVTVGGQPVNVVFQRMVWDGYGDPKFF